MCIYVMLTTSLNVTVGYTGLLNLGHVAFFGIGAYVSAILTVTYGWPLVLAMCMAAAVSAVCAAGLIRLVQKLTDDYLALAILGFTFIMFSLFNNLRSITRGASGIFGIPKPEFFGIVLKTPETYFWFALCIAVIAVFFVIRLVNSPFGKVLEAIRDDEYGAMALQKNTIRLKRIAFMISGSIAGIAGSVYAHYISFVDPTMFFLSEIIIVFTMVMVGGLGSIRGSIFATILIISLQESLKFVPMAPGLLGPMRNIVFAIMLIAILMYRPKGLLGRVELS